MWDKENIEGDIKRREIEVKKRRKQHCSIAEL